MVGSSGTRRFGPEGWAKSRDPAIECLTCIAHHPILELPVSQPDVPADDRKSAGIALHSEHASMIDARYHAFAQDPGALFGPWHLLGRISPRTLSRALRRFQPTDEHLADRPLLRDLTSHLVIIARAGASSR